MPWGHLRVHANSQEKYSRFLGRNGMIKPRSKLPEKKALNGNPRASQEGS
jgi:hypothetical protein